MARAFPTRSDCPDVPDIDAIDGDLSLPEVKDPADPITQFPFFDLPPPEPPSFDFGCFTPSLDVGVNVDENGDPITAEQIDPSVTASVNVDDDELGNCAPIFELDLGIPPCAEAFTSGSISVDDAATEPSINFTAARRVNAPCASDFTLDITLPSLGDSCRARAATTGDITLSGTQTIDGVSTSENDIVLVKDQTSGDENGAYLVKSGNWERTCTIKAGMIVTVREGTTNGATAWLLTTGSPITVGVTPLDFELISGAACCCFAKAATAGSNIASLAGGKTIDGVSLGSGDICLVKDQTDKSENGVYIVRTGSDPDPDWERTCELSAGLLVTVREGTQNKLTAWILTTDDPITPDTTDLDFEIQRAPGNPVADLVEVVADITLSGIQTIDGVSATAGTVVLLTAQTDPAENGLYVTAAGAWTRSTGIHNSIHEGVVISVRNGSANSGTAWMVTTSAPITVGTTGIAIVQVGASRLFHTVRLATNSNISGFPFSGDGGTIDGQTTVVGDRILVRRQTTPSENGVYIVQSGAWTLDPNVQGVEDELIAVKEGDVLSRTFWLTLDDTPSYAGMGAVYI